MLPKKLVISYPPMVEYALYKEDFIIILLWKNALCFLMLFFVTINFLFDISIIDLYALIILVFFLNGIAEINMLSNNPHKGEYPIEIEITNIEIKYITRKNKVRNVPWKNIIKITEIPYGNSNIHVLEYYISREQSIIFKRGEVPLSEECATIIKEHWEKWKKEKCI